jgi:hypothetical protein
LVKRLDVTISLTPYYRTYPLDGWVYDGEVPIQMKFEGQLVHELVHCFQYADQYSVGHDSEKEATQVEVEYLKVHWNKSLKNIKK